MRSEVNCQFFKSADLIFRTVDGHHLVGGSSFFWLIIIIILFSKLMIGSYSSSLYSSEVLVLFYRVCLAVLHRGLYLHSYKLFFFPREKKGTTLTHRYECYS